MASDAADASCEHRLHDVLDRIIHVWALIKMVPEHHLADFRRSVESELMAHHCRVESELMVIGLKYLHRVDGPGRR